MGWSDILNALTGQTPSNVAAQTINVAHANQANQLQNEYAAAQADPNSGIGLSPAMQQMQEQELTNHIRGQMSDAGAGLSGASNDAVTKGIVDLRIQMMKARMQHLDSLRTAMLQASQPQVQQPSPLQQGVTNAIGQGTTRLFQDPNAGRFSPTDPNDPRFQEWLAALRGPTSAPTPPAPQMYDDNV